MTEPESTRTRSGVEPEPRYLGKRTVRTNKPPKVKTKTKSTLPFFTWYLQMKKTFSENAEIKPQDRNDTRDQDINRHRAEQVRENK